MSRRWVYRVVADEKPHEPTTAFREWFEVNRARKDEWALLELEWEYLLQHGWFRRRFFDEHSAWKRVYRLRDYGVTAHVERAPIGTWESFR